MLRRTQKFTARSKGSSGSSEKAFSYMLLAYGRKAISLAKRSGS